jgi:hypothetical protein
MPAYSEKQREMFAIAEHHPEKLNKENKDVAKLPHSTLHEFASSVSKHHSERDHSTRSGMREHKGY